MVFGTFDVFHKGHAHFFRQAKKLSRRPFLVVSIARDKNVETIKGRKPLHNEKQRFLSVRETGLADKVVLGGTINYLTHILKEKPQIIALGYDQKNYTKNLGKILKTKGLQVKIVRLKPFKPHVYKSSLVKARMHDLVL